MILELLESILLTLTWSWRNIDDGESRIPSYSRGVPEKVYSKGRKGKAFL